MDAYKTILDNDGRVFGYRSPGGTVVPLNPSRPDYQALQAAVSGGAAAIEEADPPSDPPPTRDERIISAIAVRKERLAAKKTAILASGLPTATKTAMADLLDGMADIVDGLVEAIRGERP